MNDWTPTIGKWNDTDNYDISEPNWKKLVSFANERYEDAGTYLEYKEGLVLKKIPFVNFTQNVLSIMGNELNVRSDFDWELCILGRLVAQTGISLDEFGGYRTSATGEWVRYFIPADFNHMDKYLKRAIISSPDKIQHKIINNIILAEALCYLRIEKCPHEDWVIDNEYYSCIEAVLDELDASVINGVIPILLQKLKEQISENKNASRNRNKTAEELYAGWDD